MASVSCRSRLRTYHGLILFLGPMRAPRAGVMGGGWWTSRFRGPSLATKGVLGGTPYTSWFMVPRLVRRPVHVPWPKFFWFFFSHAYAALYCTTSGPGGKVTSSLLGPYRYECHREEELLAGSCQPSTHPAFQVHCDHCCPVQCSASSGCFFCRLYANFSCFLACFPA